MKKILITGGTGFVGTHLTKALLDSQTDIDITVTCHRPDKPWVYKEIIGGSKKMLAVDLCDAVAVAKLISQVKPDEIYHLASIAQVGSSFDQARRVLENNFQLQLNLLEAIATLSPHTKTLAVSSAAIYDVARSSKSPLVDENCPIEPNNPYAASKAIQDMMSASFAYAHQLQLVRVRPFNHIGPGQGSGFVVPDLTHKILTAIAEGKTTITTGNLKAKRDFTDVRDVVAAYILLMNKGESTKVYNIGSGKSHFISDILDQLITISGTKLKPIIDPNLLRPVDTPDIIADISRLASLGWKPQIPLSQTLADIYNDAQNHFHHH